MLKVVHATRFACFRFLYMLYNIMVGFADYLPRANIGTGIFLACGHYFGHQRRYLSFSFQSQSLFCWVKSSHAGFL